MKQLELDLGVQIDAAKVNPNPMVRAFGFGPQGKKCKDCKHLYYKVFYRKRYYKCRFRGDTNGPGTDHRVRWDACAKFSGL